jgi:Flp pilus assembly protein TadB
MTKYLVPYLVFFRVAQSIFDIYICCYSIYSVGTTAMIWVVMGISVSILVIIFVILVGIFFIKEKADNKKAKDFRRKRYYFENHNHIVSLSFAFIFI